MGTLPPFARPKRRPGIKNPNYANIGEFSVNILLCVMAKILLLSCSKAKRAGFLPAIDLYDGPAFRVVRRHAGENLNVWVLSAKHGLIPANKRIGHYDRFMTSSRASALRPQVKRVFDRIEQNRADEWMVCMGRVYDEAMADCVFPSSAREIKGAIGRRASVLKWWLNDRPANIAVKGDSYSEEEKSILICGKKIRTSVAKALRLTAHPPPAAANFQTWYVEAPAGGRVSVKWLVSEVSGLPVAKFRTSDALRFLSVLGVSVKRQ